ncbi:reverse transcriptase domain-containing protein [Tanacetum coccineum]
MRRVSKGYTGVDIPLFLTMHTSPKSSPSRITSSPSLSPQTHPSISQQPPIPPFMQTIHDAQEPATMPHDSSQPKKVEDLQNDLKQTKLTYGAAYTKLILRVKKLEHKGRTSADTEILLDQEEPTKLVEDPGSGEKGEKEISTAKVLVGTASVILEVSTTIPERQVYIRRSAEKRKDKGKAIMKDDESINEEERQRIARDAKIAKQLQEEIDIARQEQEKYDLAQALELQKELDKRKEGKEKEVSEEELKKLLVIVPIEEVYIEALQVKYPIIVWEDLVKKKFSSTEPIIDKEKVLWVKLKRLLKPDDDDTLWKLQRYMHDPLKWKLYDTCGVHHVSTKREHDIFMLVEKDYPLTRALMTVMLANKLQVDESSEMANELLRKIFYQVLSYDESKSKRVSKHAFMILFGQDNESFTSTMFLYVDQLQNQLDKDEFQEDKSMAAFWVLNNQFQKFIDWQYFLDYNSEMTKKPFAKYTRIKMQSRESKVILSKALDASLVVTKCSGTKSDEHITSSSSGTYITHVVDANIRPVNDQVPSIEVHLTAQHNVLANEQQHTDQSEPSYDTYLLEKVDINTTPDLTNMSHRGGEIDQDAEQAQVKSPLLKAEFLKMNDMVEKEVYNELSNRFLQLEKHCISLKIAMQQKEEIFRSNKPQKSHTQEPGRQIFSGHRFSPKKTSAVYEKTSPRSCLRWKPTGTIFTIIGLKWIPTGKLFDSCTSKVDSEPPNGLNDDITNPYECDQTLNVSAGLGYQLMTPGIISSGLVPQPPSLTPNVLPTNNDWDSLFRPMFDEYKFPGTQAEPRDLPKDISISYVESLEHPSDTQVFHNDDGNPARANIKQALRNPDGSSSANDGPKAPVFLVRKVFHEGCANRIRAMTQRPHICATWRDNGHVQDTRLGKSPAASIKAHDADVNVISWNRLASCMLASGSDDGAFSICDLRMLNEGDTVVAHFTYHKRAITSIEWSPHEAFTLAVSSDDNQLTTWDLSLERDEEEEAEFKAKTQEEVHAPTDLPLQLFFVHQAT